MYSTCRYAESIFTRLWFFRWKRAMSDAWKGTFIGGVRRCWNCALCYEIIAIAVKDTHMYMPAWIDTRFSIAASCCIAICIPKCLLWRLAVYVRSFSANSGKSARVTWAYAFVHMCEVSCVRATLQHFHGRVFYYLRYWSPSTTQREHLVSYFHRQNAAAAQTAISEASRFIWLQRWRRGISLRSNKRDFQEL